MVTFVVLLYGLARLAVAEEPIVKLKAQCPSTSSGNPLLRLTADVPAFGMARCRNGDKKLTETDQVNFQLAGSFDQSYTGVRCLFYKKAGSNTYTVDVEVGWGERDSQVIKQQKIHTMSCAYDDHGRALSNTATVSDWFLNPLEAQTLVGGNSSAKFSLKLIDVLDNEITGDAIPIGRKVRLKAEDISGKLAGFRALSCSVQNTGSRYYILRAGCGDGLVFDKTAGFQTLDDKVYSPYFDAFKLAGGDDSVVFECRFTECNGACNGDSCTVETGGKRKKRSELGTIISPPFVLTSIHYRAK